MAIYAIGDLHLSFQTNKPMDIFGDQWKNYLEKLEKNWRKLIYDDDLVILLGDFSWGMNLKDTLLDFKFIDSLPGIKVLIKGNHDFWWKSLKKNNDFIKENGFKNIFFIQNNSFEYKGYAIVGTRGWSFLNSENSEKMKNREAIRLTNSILSVQNRESKKIICAMHYPPVTEEMVLRNDIGPYLQILKKYNINNCYYGHLHGRSHCEAVEGEIEGIRLELVSSDYINFEPKRITI